jgi:hypothetical protein
LNPAFPSALLFLRILGGPEVEPVSGHRYLLLEPAPWPESEQAAQVLGGHLASIGSPEEQRWVFGTFGNRGGVERSLWIGLSRSTPGGPFVWSDGSGATYRNWLPGQPDDALGGEPHVHMISRANTFGHPGGTWNDLGTPGAPFTDFDPVCGVVELPPLELRFDSAPTTGSPGFSCPTLPGFLYRIERTDDLVSGNWVDAGVSVLGDGAVWKTELPAGVTATRFYRAVEIPPAFVVGDAVGSVVPR